MNLPTIESGMRILAEHINRIMSEVRSNAITSVTGGTFQRTTSGTSIQIPQQFNGGGGGAAPVADCIFKITDATEGETVQIEIGFGTVNYRIPDGMILGTPYLLPVSGSGFVYAVAVFDTVTLTIPADPGYLTLSFETEQQQHTADTLFILLGTVVSDGTSISQVYSVCNQPTADPCLLAWETPQ
jgi:hypothetical protein